MTSSGFKIYQLAKCGDYDGLKTAFSLSKINYCNNDEGGNNLLFAAIDSRKNDVIYFLLNNIIDLDYKNKIGWTALHKVSCDGLWEIASKLLAKGANPNVRDNFGEYPIHLSVWNGHSKVVKLLLEYSAKPNATQNNGWTPIAYAASKGHVTIVKILKSKGADINFQGKDGLTPLHFLTFSKSAMGVKILLDNGADPLIRNERGLTALECAEERGAIDIIKAFSDFGISWEKPINECNHCRIGNASIRLPCYHNLCMACYHNRSSCNICSTLLYNTSL